MPTKKKDKKNMKFKKNGSKNMKIKKGGSMTEIIINNLFMLATYLLVLL